MTHTGCRRQIHIDALQVTGATITSTPSEGAAASTALTYNLDCGEASGLKTSATRRIEGTIFLSKSAHLSAIENSGRIQQDAYGRWLIVGGRYMSLETIARLSDDPIVKLPAVAAADRPGPAGDYDSLAAVTPHIGTRSLGRFRSWSLRVPVL
jgi:hypothetical protein